MNKNKYISLLLVIMTAVLLISAAGCGKGGDGSPKKIALSENSTVQFPVTDFDDGKAKHYELENNGIKFRFFILKSSDGVIRTAFDACDVCWQSNQGYVQQDDYMICRNCGLKFKSVNINEMRGGCNPAPLMSELKDGNVIITLEALSEGEKYFDFKSGGSK